MTYELLTNWNFSTFDYSLSHFNKVFSQISNVQSQKDSELEVISEFFKEFEVMEHEYKNKLIQICIKYQSRVYETFKDEKMQQFFQILFNNLLQKSDIITKSHDHFKSFNEKMTALNENFKKNTDGKISLLENNKQRFEDKIYNMKINYSEYMKLSDMKNDECYKKIDELREKSSKIKWISQEINTVQTFDEKFKLLDKIQNFSIDVGKSICRELKEFIKDEKTNSTGLPPKTIVMEFNTKFDSLRVVSQSKIKSLLSKLQMSEQSILTNTQKTIQELTERTYSEYSELSSNLTTYLSKQEKFINSCAQYELDWKDKIKAQLIQFMCRYFENKQDEILQKAANANENMENFISKFKYIIKVYS